ncbi:hypothetical protein GJ496_004216 [Pomphorhynchus laevis]|nr:hypothetical protein GJ496_004216 [Pomphorhynchus laevis]
MNNQYRRRNLSHGQIPINNRMQSTYRYPLLSQSNHPFESPSFQQYTRHPQNVCNSFNQRYCNNIFPNQFPIQSQEFYNLSKTTAKSNRTLERLGFQCQHQKDSGKS